MELPGEVYLFNHSILAITFSAVSALVMLLRQTMGGRLSSFDIYLTSSFISSGFVIAVDAVLPPLVSLLEPPPAILWPSASGLAAVLLAVGLLNRVAMRRKASSAPMPRNFLGRFVVEWIAVLLLAANAVIPQVQGIGLFAVALTLAMVLLMWAFVRRIASLLGEKPGEDWDPRRG